MWRSLFIAACCVLLSFASSHAESFDGVWSILEVCDSTKEGARGYTWRYDATVKDGHLVGQYRSKGQNPSLTLEGQIKPDGTASLSAEGISARFRSQYRLCSAPNPDFVSRHCKVRTNEGRGQPAGCSRLQVHV